jgi:hypothetical protein
MSKSPSEKKTRQLIPRPPRYKLKYSHSFFLASFDDKSVQLPILNMSLRGINFSHSNGLKQLAVEDIVSGKICIDKDEVSVKVKVLHITNEFVGCSFVSIPNNFEAWFYQNFKPEISGQNLIVIDPKILSHKFEGEPYYFRGSNSDEIYYTLKKEKIHYFSMQCDGHFLSGGNNTSLKFGKVLKLIDEKPHGYKRADNVEWGIKLTEPEVNFFKRFIENATEINVNHTALLIDQLS